MDMSSLSDRVRDRRSLLGLTQEGLAEAAGVGQSSVARIESGDTPTPRADTLLKIARALGVSVEWLQGSDEADAPSPDPGPQTAPSVVEGDLQTPTLGHLAGWSDLERAARKKAPDIDGWVWDELRVTNPLFTARIPLTVAAVVQLARLVAEHGTPPSSRRK